MAQSVDHQKRTSSSLSNLVYSDLPLKASLHCCLISLPHLLFHYKFYCTQELDEFCTAM